MIALVLVGCKVEILLDINVEAASGGRVELSATVNDEVLARAPGWAQQIETSDLRAAGWTVSISESGHSLKLGKPFSSADELNAALAEIDVTGTSANRPRSVRTDGLFSEAALDVNYEDASTLYSLRLEMNLDLDLTHFIDPSVANLFGGNLLGVPTEELLQRAGFDPSQQDLRDAVGVAVSASLPQASTRLPDTGFFRLNEGGVKGLLLTSEIIDEELGQALAESDQASSDSRRVTLLVLAWWLVLAIGAAAVVAAVVLRDRNRF